MPVCSGTAPPARGHRTAPCHDVIAGQEPYPRAYPRERAASRAKARVDVTSSSLPSGIARRVRRPFFCVTFRLTAGSCPFCLGGGRRRPARAGVFAFRLGTTSDSALDRPSVPFSHFEENWISPPCCETIILVWNAFNDGPGSQVRCRRPEAKARQRSPHLESGDSALTQRQPARTAPPPPPPGRTCDSCLSTTASRTCPNGEPDHAVTRRLRKRPPKRCLRAPERPTGVDPGNPGKQLTPLPPPPRRAASGSGHSPPHLPPAFGRAWLRCPLPRGPDRPSRQRRSPAAPDVPPGSGCSNLSSRAS